MVDGRQRENILIGAPVVSGREAQGPGEAFLHNFETGELLKRIPSPATSADALHHFGLSIATVSGNFVVGYGQLGFPKNELYILDGETGELLTRIESPYIFGPIAAAGRNFVAGWHNVPISDGSMVGEAYLFIEQSDDNGDITLLPLVTAATATQATRGRRR